MNVLAGPIAVFLATSSMVWLTSCVPRAKPVVLGEADSLSVIAKQPIAELDLPGCLEGDFVVTNDRVAVELACRDRHRDCRGELPVAIRNCQRDPVLVSRIVLRSDWDATEMIVEFDPLPAVRSGESWSHGVTMSWPRELEIEIEVVTLDGATRSVGMRAAVRNPDRDEAMARCQECNGDWGRHGLLGLEGCLCRARDGGAECRDGRDCEGTCLYERSERVQQARQECRDGYCDVTLAMFVLVGRCSEFVTTFGCHHYLPDGISDQGPFMSSYPAPYRCCD